MVGKQKNPFQGSFAVDQDGSNLLGLQSCPQGGTIWLSVGCYHITLWGKLIRKRSRCANTGGVFCFIRALSGNKIRVRLHQNQNDVDNPADAQQTEGEQVQHTHADAPFVKFMRTKIP